MASQPTEDLNNPSAIHSPKLSSDSSNVHPIVPHMTQQEPTAVVVSNDTEVLSSTPNSALEVAMQDVIATEDSFMNPREASPLLQDISHTPEASPEPQEPIVQIAEPTVSREPVVVEPSETSLKQPVVVQVPVVKSELAKLVQELPKPAPEVVAATVDAPSTSNLDQPTTATTPASPSPSGRRICPFPSCRARLRPTLTHTHCSFCNSTFCPRHFLPEAHACPNLGGVRKMTFERNRGRLMREKCVAAKV